MGRTSIFNPRLYIVRSKNHCVEIAWKSVNWNKSYCKETDVETYRRTTTTTDSYTTANYCRPTDPDFFQHVTKTTPIILFGLRHCSIRNLYLVLQISFFLFAKVDCPTDPDFFQLATKTTPIILFGLRHWLDMKCISCPTDLFLLLLKLIATV